MGTVQVGARTNSYTISNDLVCVFAEPVESCYRIHGRVDSVLKSVWLSYIRAKPNIAPVLYFRPQAVSVASSPAVMVSMKRRVSAAGNCCTCSGVALASYVQKSKVAWALFS